MTLSPVYYKAFESQNFEDGYFDVTFEVEGKVSLFFKILSMTKAF